LIGKAKAARQNKEFIHYFPSTIHLQVFSYLQESRAPSHVIVTWEDKC